jgi:hypothetical protein
MSNLPHYKIKQINDAYMYNHAMNYNKYYNLNNGRVPFGILNGNDVSITKNNIVDKESYLKSLKKTDVPDKSLINLKTVNFNYPTGVANKVYNSNSKNNISPYFNPIHWN